MKRKNEKDILYSLEKHASMTNCVGCAYVDEWPEKCLVRLLSDSVSLIKEKNAKINDLQENKNAGQP